MPSTQQPRIKLCNRPGCKTIIKPGQLACREHWAELTPDLRDRLVEAWEKRKAHPDVPELVHVHRSLLLEALKQWKVPIDLLTQAMRRAPRAASQSCPFCGAPQPFHRKGCQFYPEEDGGSVTPASIDRKEFGLDG
jgi:hypothetical protein